MEKSLFERMFDDIGKKIQDAAKKIAIFNFAASIIVGLIMFIMGMADSQDYGSFIVTGPVIIVIGCVAAWISAIVLYGFGKLIEDVEAIRNKYTNTEIKTATATVSEHKKNIDENKAKDNSTKEIIRNTSKTVTPTKSKNNYYCPECGSTLTVGQKECLCSVTLNWSNCN